MTSGWILHPADDAALQAVTVERYTQLYQSHRQEGMENGVDFWAMPPRGWPVEARSFRHLDPWRIFLLLTPWMLMRVLMPMRDPGLPLPPGWGEPDGPESGGLLGPLLTVYLLGQKQMAHLHRDPVLGDYLIQPLVQSLHKYANPEAVFSAWTETVQRRDAFVQASNRRCDWQQDLSRREIFSGLFRERKPSCDTTT
ncbi:MAG: DUF3457 domain-containing protein [Magnetococcales bacterium]|nr:DUF3457 domain-containing protein [Magnetococcales bacterium]